MLSLFMVEAALLGVTGSVLGAGAGVLISRWLVTVLGRTTTFLLDWSLQPATLIMGVLVGIVTTLIFAVVAIVRTSSVRWAPTSSDSRRRPAHTPISSTGISGYITVMNSGENGYSSARVATDSK